MSELDTWGEFLQATTTGFLPVSKEDLSETFPYNYPVVAVPVEADKVFFVLGGSARVCGVESLPVPMIEMPTEVAVRIIPFLKQTGCTLYFLESPRSETVRIGAFLKEA